MTAANTLALVLGVVTGPLLARALGAPGRGTLAAIVVPLTVIPVLINLGLPSYATRQAARGMPLGVLLGSVGGLSLVIGAIVAGLAHPLATALSDGRHVVYIYLLIGISLMPLPQIGNVLFSTAIGLERWGLVNAARIVPPAIAAVGIAVLFALDRLTVASAAIVTMVSGVGGVASNLRLFSGLSEVRFRVPVAREALVFGSKAWLATISTVANHQLDQLLMIVFVDARQLGLYVVAVSLSGLSGVMTGALSSTLLPRAAQGDVELPARALRVMLALLAASSFLIGAAAPWVLPLLFGAAFRDALVMTWILLVAVLPGQGALVLGSLLTAAGRPGAAASGQVIALVATVPGLFLLLPAYGGVGAALVSLLAYGLNFAYLLKISTGHFNCGLRKLLVPTSDDVSFVRDLAISVGRRLKLNTA